MPKPKLSPFVIGALLLSSVQMAFGANVWLTDKQFQSRGAAEFTGTILNVQISSSTPNTESGTVELSVDQVVMGTIAAPTITFSFERSLVLTDYLSNWDLVTPLGKSLTTAIGDKLVVFVTESSGVYSIYPANNSVQAISGGLLVGKIVAVHHKDDDAFDQKRDDGGELEIQVSETVYGWVNGTTVTLKLPKHLPHGEDDARSAELNGPAASMLNSLGDQSRVSGANAEVLADDGKSHDDKKQVVVAFQNGKISGIEVASKKFLSDLATMDSQ